MGLQHKAETRLLHRYRQLATAIAIFALLAILAFLYFQMLPGLTGEALQVEHRRLQLVLASVRSQWQIHGQPQYMDLSWVAVPHVTNQDTLIKMSPHGWPLPDELNDQGCELLWFKLLGVKLDSWEITGNYQPQTHSCKFTAVNLTSVIYKLSSGNVNFLTD